MARAASASTQGMRSDAHHCMLGDARHARGESDGSFGCDVAGVTERWHQDRDRQGALTYMCDLRAAVRQHYLANRWGR
jgi:hypothetical protein